MTRQTHDLVNDHFGVLSDIQIADGTPASGDVPINNGDGTSTWGPQTGGSALSVTDGSTTVDPTTELNFTSGATVTDAGGGVAEVAISGSGGQFDDDADSLGLGNVSEGYDFPVDRGYIRMHDYGNAGEDAWVSINQGSVSLLAQNPDASNPDNAAALAQFNIGTLGSVVLDGFDDNNTAEFFLAPNDVYIDGGIVPVRLVGPAAMFPMHSSDPSSPAEGWFYYNTTSHKLRFYNGTTWGDV